MCAYFALGWDRLRLPSNLLEEAHQPLQVTGHLGERPRCTEVFGSIVGHACALQQKVRGRLLLVYAAAAKWAVSDAQRVHVFVERRVDGEGASH